VPSKVELFEQIRRERRLDELSARELAQRHGVHRRTVRQALDNAVPPPRKPYAVRARPAALTAPETHSHAAVTVVEIDPEVPMRAPSGGRREG
jgi:hypothetical protein